MKLLCIGKSGQVARALAEHSIARGISCIFAGRPELDLRDPASLSTMIDQERPNLVVNAAAYTNVDGAETNGDEAHAVNAKGPGQLASICASQDLPLIHLSTEYVFDGALDRAYNEADATNPINVYGASKLAGEQVVRDHCSKHVILRTSWVISPFGQNFLKTMLRLADSGGPVSVVDDQMGAPTSAGLIADAILDIAVQIYAGQGAYGVYHFAPAGRASWADVAEAIFAIYEQRTGCKIRLNRIVTSDYPTAATRPLNSQLDSGKVVETFGLALPHWSEGIAQTVNRLMDERADVR